MALVPLGAKLLVKLRVSRRQAAFADQLDDSLQLMAGSLRAGHSLLRAVDSVASEADAPTSEEFARIVNETRVGRDLNDALDEVAERMGSEDFVWVAQAIAIHREVGGNLAEVLDAVGHTIRERNAIRRQVKALSAEGKLSAIVLMALPFGVTGFISMSNPAYLAKFTQSLTGYAMLAVAGVMLLVGGLWLKSTVKIKF
jgi:tight adherence protein B